MKTKFCFTLIGIFLPLLSSASFADKGGQPHRAAPGHAPRHAPAPHVVAPPPPVQHAPASRAPAPPARIHQAPVQAPKAQLPARQAPVHVPQMQAPRPQVPVQAPKFQAPGQIRQSPVQIPRSQSPVQGPKFKAPGSQAPVQSPRFQGPMRTPTSKTPTQPSGKSHRLKSLPPQTPLGAPPPSMRGPSSSSPKFGSPGKQLTTPSGGAILPPTPSAKGPFPKIRTQKGAPFKPWATLPPSQQGPQTPSTTEVPSVSQQRSFQPSGVTGFRSGGVTATYGGRGFRGKDGFRHRSHRNFLSAFWLAPALIAPYYYSNSYYPNNYYPPDIYSPPYYDLYTFYPEPYYIRSYIYEEPYYEPNYIEIYIYTNEVLYPEGYNINQPSPYLSEPYRKRYVEREEPLSLEIQELQALLQSVLEAMKIFDISVFYTLPEFSMLIAAGSE